MSEFEQSLYAVLISLPHGTLCTYGQLAKRSGYPAHARHVGRALSKLPKETKLPWHRVVNSQGKLSLSGEGFLRQQARLNKEGIMINDQGKVINFKQYLW